MLQCTDFLMLKPRGIDLVLGVQWLRELGPITWDFSKLTMHFSIGVQNVVLQGMTAGVIQLANKKQTSRMISSSKSNCALLMTIFSESRVNQPTASISNWPKELQDLLWQYHTLFETPRGLTPSRKHDHKIKLTDESQTVTIRPYKYSAVQKDEIERVIAEMKETSII